MAQVARQNIGLSAPQSRQDIVSALLTQYGNSFASDGTSPSGSAFSPVPADKELPPPPPGSDSMRNKPLPAVQRAEQRMSTKFQLRSKLTFIFLLSHDCPESSRSRLRKLGRVLSLVCISSSAYVHHTLPRHARAVTFSIATPFQSTCLPLFGSNDTARRCHSHHN
jgi:hypothetical protein